MQRLALLCLVICSLTLTGQEETPAWPALDPAKTTDPLPGTAVLNTDEDLSFELVKANDRFLDRQILKAAEERDAVWKRDTESAGAWTQSVAKNRARLAQILGLDRDWQEGPRYDPDGSVVRYHGTTPGPALSIGPEESQIEVREITWEVFGGIRGRGLVVEPAGKAVAEVVVIPDTSQDVYDLVVNAGSMPPVAQVLARAGCRVFVPTRLSREIKRHTITERDWLHRASFELGRTVPGYELHKILSLIEGRRAQRPNLPLGVAGWGDGGQLALFSAALAEESMRIDAAFVSGYFGPREELWKESADHQLFGFVSEFGDAEVGSLVVPRRLLIEAVAGPDFRYRTHEGSRELEILTERIQVPKGKPGRSSMPSVEEAKAEWRKLRAMVGDELALRARFVQSGGSPYSEPALKSFLGDLGIEVPKEHWYGFGIDTIRPRNETGPGSEYARAKEIAEVEARNQVLITEGEVDRADFFAGLKLDSLESFDATIEPYREFFRTRVIGDFELPLAPPNPRSRPYQESEKTISYEVVLDVFDEVYAYGVLTLPKDLDLSSGEKRPVVVCQHGLEGTPQVMLGEEKFKAYRALATRLAERGFITFAPQNGYKYFDLFRLQQAKAQSIGKTLFSIIVPQHQQITDWLGGLPFVDSERIAFYGLSYGGKSAMRIPPLVENYCLSICSADFNDWVWKNAATDERALRYSYTDTLEYEMFEWNLGGTFNYAEMATLICPRPFMVERGHFDGVGSDERVAYEFAKVRHLYQAKLGIGDRCEIEWFVGPHAINGEGTFRFLHRHLDWPEP